MKPRAPTLLVLTVTLALVGCGASSDAPDSALQPDVVLVIVDTLRTDRTGLLKPGLTPRMSALGEQGVAYTTAIAPSSWTLPSMAALFAGREIVGRRTTAFDDATLAERFSEAGYRTIGLVANPLLTDDNGFTRGFDEFDVAPAVATKQRIADAEMIAVMRDWDAAALASRAMAALDAAPRDSPVFLYIHMMDPHLPYDPGHMRRAAREDDWSRGPISLMWHDEPLSDEESRAITTLRRAYDGQVTFVDDALGRLGEFVSEGRAREAVKGVSAERRPWLFGVTADHGEGLFTHRRNPDSPSPDDVLFEAYVEHGEQVYEEAIRVPLWLVGHGVPAGRVESRPVPMHDLGATLASLAGIADLGPVGRTLPLTATDPAPDTVFGAGTRDWFARTDTAKLIVPFAERRKNGIEDRRVDVASEAFLPEMDELPADAQLNEAFDAWRTTHASEPDSTDAATLERLKRLGYVK